MDDTTVLPRPEAATPAPASFHPECSTAFQVVAATVVFRVVRGELSIGLPFAPTSGGDLVRVVPTAAPSVNEADGGLASAARAAAARVVAAREIVRISNAGVRAIAPTDGAPAQLAVVSWAIARPILHSADAAQALEADEAFVPLSALGELDAPSRAILSCAFESFLDSTLADALTRRLLPRHILFRKTDGFTNRSPFETALGAPAQPTEPEIPIFVGLLPDPFPLSALRELYERLLDAPLDRGNFRRQFHEIIALGPIKALPIFERGVPHRAGQLFTFDKPSWARFASS
jgi:hypothetical protein